MKITKKVFGIVLSVILIVTLIPSVFADGSNVIDDRSQLISTACDIFPEFSEQILMTSLPNKIATFSQPEVVRSLCRTTEDGDILTYTEYSNGVVLLSSGSVLNTGCTPVVIDSNTTDYTLSFKVTANVSDDILTITNLKYRNSSGKASILSRGSAQHSKGTRIFYASEYRQAEGYLTNACTGFSCDFSRKDGSLPIELTFMFYVAGNRWWTNAKY